MDATIGDELGGPTFLDAGLAIDRLGVIPARALLLAGPAGDDKRWRMARAERRPETNAVPGLPESVRRMRSR